MSPYEIHFTDRIAEKHRSEREDIGFRQCNHGRGIIRMYVDELQWRQFEIYARYLHARELKIFLNNDFLFVISFCKITDYSLPFEPFLYITNFVKKFKNVVKKLSHIFVIVLKK